MLLILSTAAALASVSPAPVVRNAPVRQARAMVVIVSAGRIGATLPVPQNSIKRLSAIRDRDGTLHRLPLIEFF